MHLDVHGMSIIWNASYITTYHQVLIYHHLKCCAEENLGQFAGMTWKKTNLIIQIGAMDCQQKDRDHLERLIQSEEGIKEFSSWESWILEINLFKGTIAILQKWKAEPKIYWKFWGTRKKKFVE